MRIAAGCLLIRRSTRSEGLPVRGEAVAAAAHCLYAGRAVGQLASEGPNHHIDDVAAAGVGRAPNLLQQFLPGDGLPGSPGQVPKYTEFEWREGRSVPADDEFVGVLVNSPTVYGEPELSGDQIR